VIRVALGAMTACVVAVGLYGLVRGLQLMIFPEPNPATVIWSAHAGYFWRAWIVSYAGGMAGLIAWKAAGRDAARVARVLAEGVLVAAALIFAQGMFLP
jgi:hypothetical protein